MAPGRKFYVAAVACLMLTACAGVSSHDPGVRSDAPAISICDVAVNADAGKVLTVTASYMGNFENALLFDDRCRGVLYDWDFPNLGLKEKTTDDFFWNHVKPGWNEGLAEYVVTFEATVSPDIPSGRTGRFIVTRILNYRKKAN